MTYTDQLPLLNIRPRPISGESWPGYLIRLAQANYLDGLDDLVRILRLNVITLVVAEPADILPRLGVAWSCEEQERYIRASNFRETSTWLNQQRGGRSTLSRFCPLCLASDKIPHIRAYWEHPVSLTCRNHDVLLLDRCQTCGQSVGLSRTRVSHCDCGGSFLKQTSTASPAWIPQFMQVFAPAFSTHDTSTFSRSNHLAWRAAYVAHRISSPLSDQIDRRIPVTFLSQDKVSELGPQLKEWPRTTARMYCGSTFRSGSGRHKIFNRKLCADDFPAIKELTSLIASRLSDHAPEVEPAG